MRKRFVFAVLLACGLAVGLYAQQPVSQGTTPWVISGALTDTQLRASAVPVTANAGTNLNTSLLLTQSDFDDLTGSKTETAPATDTASSGLNGRLQRIAQRLTSLITAVGSPFQAGGSIGNTTFASTVADGANVTQGAKADSAATDSTSSWTVIALLKGLYAKLAGTLTVGGSVTATQATGSNLHVVVDTAPSTAVTQSTSPWIVAGGGTAGTAATGVVTIQGIASMTKLLVTPDANSAVNVAQINGVAPSMGNGTSGTGVQRVTLASDSTGIVALTTGSAQIGHLEANQSVNLNQVAGATISQTNPVPTVFPGTLVSGAVTTAMTGTTSTSVVSGTGSNYLYITNCVVSNASTTVSTDINLQDGSGGTTLYVLPAPAAAVATTGGGGSVTAFPVPLKVPTSGNALYAANVTTGSSTKISCSGFRSTVSY